MKQQNESRFEPRVAPAVAVAVISDVGKPDNRRIVTYFTKIMTISKNTLIGAAVALVLLIVVTSIYQLRQREARDAMLVSKTASLRPLALTPPVAERDRLLVELEALVRENHALREKIEGGKAPAPDSIAGKVAALKDILAGLPEQSIPELSFATEGDWYSAADGSLDTIEDIRASLSRACPKFFLR